MQHGFYRIYTYPLGKKPALKNITCTFEKGKFYGIIGENAGGKTTLCNLIRGLVPHFYHGKLEGEAMIEGVKIQEANIDVLSTKIGYFSKSIYADQWSKENGLC